MVRFPSFLHPDSAALPADRRCCCDILPEALHAGTRASAIHPGRLRGGARFDAA